MLSGTGPLRTVEICGELTRDEDQVHFSLWAMLSAPLIAGNDLEKMTDETKSILMNRDVIAVDQDSLGNQAKRIWAEGPLEIWQKKLANGRVVLAFFNRGESEMFVNASTPVLHDFLNMQYKNLWAKGELNLDSKMKIDVLSHGVVMLEQE